MATTKPCKDCLSLGAATRPAPHPGPRCYSHHRAVVKARKLAAHRTRVTANFGLADDGYDRLLASQGGACGGCGRTPGPRAKRLAVDHDHKCCPGTTSCGRCVRGLLCHRCNDTLAHMRDDPERLIRLARYLREWPSLKADL